MTMENRYWIAKIRTNLPRGPTRAGPYCKTGGN